MRLSEFAVKLFEAVQDGVPAKVLIQKISLPDRMAEQYFVKIADQEYKVSKQIALNAISWHVPVDYKETEYKFYSKSK